MLILSVYISCENSYQKEVEEKKIQLDKFVLSISKAFRQQQDTCNCFTCNIFPSNDSLKVFFDKEHPYHISYGLYSNKDNQICGHYFENIISIKENIHIKFKVINKNTLMKKIYFYYNNNDKEEQTFLYKICTIQPIIIEGEIYTKLVKIESTSSDKINFDGLFLFEN